MEEAKHTPGPWRVEEGTTVIWSSNAYDPATNNIGCIVARAAQPLSWKGSRPSADEQDANALLISAAPDMLEALRPFAKVYGMDIGIDEDDADLFQIMREHNRAPKLTVGDFKRAYTAVFFSMGAA